MFDPAYCFVASTVSSDYNPAREDQDFNHAIATKRAKTTSESSSKELQDSDIPARVKRHAQRLFETRSEVAAWYDHLRARREATRVEAGKYLENLRRRAGGDPMRGLDFNPAAEDRDRFRALFEEEIANLSAQREHIRDNSHMAFEILSFVCHCHIHTT